MVKQTDTSSWLKARWTEFKEGFENFDVDRAGDQISTSFGKLGDDIQEGVQNLQMDSDEERAEGKVIESNDNNDKEEPDVGESADATTLEAAAAPQVAVMAAAAEPTRAETLEERRAKFDEDPTYKDFATVGEGTTDKIYVPPERPLVDSPVINWPPPRGEGAAPLAGGVPVAMAAVPGSSGPFVQQQQQQQQAVFPPAGNAPPIGIQQQQQAAGTPIILAPYPAYPNQQFAVPPPQTARPQPQKNKSIGSFFFGNKNKAGKAQGDQPQQQQFQFVTQPQQQQQQVVNPMPVPPRQPITAAAQQQATVVYDPRSSLRQSTSGPGLPTGSPPSGVDYPPPGGARNFRRSPPPVPEPDYDRRGEMNLPPGAPAIAAAEKEMCPPTRDASGSIKSVFHPPGSLKPLVPEPSREGATTPLSMAGSAASHMSVGKFGFGVGYLDIIPTVQDKFDVLIDHANDWLAGCKQTFKPIGFETLKVPCDEDGAVSTENPLSEIGKEQQHCSILRMWVMPKSEGDDQEDQLRVSYMCLFPRWCPESRNKKPCMPTPETLDDTLCRYNAEFAASKTLKGRVINMETMNHLHAFHQEGCPIHLDPEACSWMESYKQDVNILSIVRVYYFDDPNAVPEIIGVQDFVPECTKGEDMTSLEPFAPLVEAASNWVKQYPGLRVTNLQTVRRISDTADDHLNTRRMMHRRRHQFPLRCSRYLRVYYTQRVDNSPEGPVRQGPGSLNYKDFVPLTEVSPRGGSVMKRARQMKIKKVEKCGDVMQKLVAWQCLSGQKVVSVETVPLMGGGKLTFDPEVNYAGEFQKDGSDHQLMAFRIYTDATVTSHLAVADDRDSGDEGGAGGPSPNGSIASRDYAAWPYNLTPREYTPGN